MYEFTFLKPSTESLMHQRAAADLTHALQERVRATTLYRYILQRDALVDQAVAAPAQVVSWRFKWDETEQVVQSKALEVPEGPTRSAVLKQHVMTSCAWVKFPGQRLQPVCALPQQLERTTSECLWRAMLASFPHGPWGEVPPQDRVTWLVFVIVGDEASSNKKLFAQAECHAMERRQGGLVMIWQPCYMHILHRSVVPLLKGIIGNLFRCAHVLSVGTYWSALFSRVHRNISESLVVTHNFDVIDPKCQAVTADILHLTVCEGKGDEDLSVRVRELRDELAQALTLDVATGRRP